MAAGNDKCRKTSSQLVIDFLSVSQPYRSIPSPKTSRSLGSLFFKIRMRAAHTIFTSLAFVIPILLAAYFYAASIDSNTSKMATKPSMFNSNGMVPPSFVCTFTSLTIELCLVLKGGMGREGSG